MSDLTRGKEIIEAAWYDIMKGLELAYGLNYKSDENFDNTPHRIGKALLEKCAGINSEEIIKEQILQTSFPSDYHGMTVVDPIDAYSLCPHHFENVSYNVSIGFIPKERCLGLSKVPRTVKLFAQQPILQEDFTKKIADLFYDTLQLEGIGVVTRGQHNCMISRGVKQQGSTVIMSELRGTFLSDPSVKDEFYFHLKH